METNWTENYYKIMIRANPSVILTPEEALEAISEAMWRKIKLTKPPLEEKEKGFQLKIKTQS